MTSLPSWCLRRLAYDKLCWNDEPAGRGSAILPGLEYPADRPRHRIGVERHGGHRGTREHAPSQATKTDESDVVRHAEAAVSRRRHATEREFVTRRQHGAKAYALGQRLRGSVVASVGAIALGNVPDQR